MLTQPMLAASLWLNSCASAHPLAHILLVKPPNELLSKALWQDIVSHEVSEVWVDARMVDSVLSVVAGVLSGMLLPPCMRAGRGLRQV